MKKGIPLVGEEVRRLYYRRRLLSLTTRLSWLLLCLLWWRREKKKKRGERKLKENERERDVGWDECVFVFFVG